MSMFYCNRCDIMEDSDEVGYVTLLNNEASCESEASDEEYNREYTVTTAVEA